MYCPRCATQNLDDAKFCRTCGTNLETVGLALAGKYPVESDSDEKEREPTALEKRREGMSKIVQASGLLGSSLLIGAALGLFSNQHDWIMIWMIFTGWMACWGIFSMVGGIAALMESKALRDSEYPGIVESRRDRALDTSGLSVPQLPSPRSITEHTTKSLGEQRPAAK